MVDGVETGRDVGGEYKSGEDLLKSSVLSLE